MKVSAPMNQKISVDKFGVFQREVRCFCSCEGTFSFNFEYGYILIKKYVTPSNTL